MSLRLDYRVFDDYLRAEFTGTRTPGQELAEGIDIWKKVADIAKKEDRNRILVATKVKGRMPVTAAFNITESLSTIGWQHDFKVAGFTEDKIAFANLSIFETIMSKLGYEAKFFQNEADAKRWLFET